MGPSWADRFGGNGLPMKNYLLSFWFPIQFSHCQDPAWDMSEEVLNAIGQTPPQNRPAANLPSLVSDWCGRRKNVGLPLTCMVLLSQQHCCCSRCAAAEVGGRQICKHFDSWSGWQPTWLRKLFFYVNSHPHPPGGASPGKVGLWYHRQWGIDEFDDSLLRLTCRAQAAC